VGLDDKYRKKIHPKFWTKSIIEMSGSRGFCCKFLKLTGEETQSWSWQASTIIKKLTKDEVKKKIQQDSRFFFMCKIHTTSPGFLLL
jgi:hypothetical protein